MGEITLAPRSWYDPVWRGSYSPGHMVTPTGPPYSRRYGEAVAIPPGGQGRRAASPPSNRPFRGAGTPPPPLAGDRSAGPALPRAPLAGDCRLRRGDAADTV